MIKLNLLSPSAKKNIKQRRLYCALKNFSIAIIILLAINSSMIFGAKHMLDQLMDEINLHTSQISANSEGYNKKVKDINQKLDFTASIQKESVNWSCFLDKIFAQSVPGIYFTSISLNKTDQTLLISGHAFSRNALLAFKSNIEKFENIQSADLPLQNLLIKENIDFSITSKINMSGTAGQP